MSLEVDYLAFATGSGANVDSQANYQGSGYQGSGFPAGLLPSMHLNKPIRQATMVGAALANFISNQLAIPVLDDGDLPGLVTNLTAAINAAAIGVSNRLISLPFSATPIFDASLGSTFEMVLTGNVTSSTLINVTPGQRLIFIIREDGTGGHAFAPPANLPMANIDTAANATNVQAFIVDSGSNVFVDTPLTVN